MVNMYIKCMLPYFVLVIKIKFVSEFSEVMALGRLIVGCWVVVVVLLINVSRVKSRGNLNSRRSAAEFL